MSRGVERTLNKDWTMLVLSRRVNEGITITAPDGTIIRLMVIECRIGKITSSLGKVRFGIQAPKDVIIHRDEVQRIVDKEKGET